MEISDATSSCSVEPGPQTRLGDAEDRYRSLIAVLEEGIVWQDPDGSIRACNPSAERILGLSTDQLAGRTSVDPLWQAIHEDGSPFPGEDHPSLVARRTGQACSHVSLGVPRPDGAVRWLSVNARPLVEAGEAAPYAVISSFVDITERRQVEQALAERTARLEAIGSDLALVQARLEVALRENEQQCRAARLMKAELVTLVSHELRTPLTSVKGYVDLILDGEAGPVDPEQREFLRIVQSNADRLAAVIDDLIETARPEGGRSPDQRSA